MIEVEAYLRRPGFTLDVAFSSEGGVTALFGPSGCGKSTTIGVIAGLVAPDRGRVEVVGETLLDTSRRINVASHKRRVGLVFQDAQLFPHMSVRQNLAFGRRFSRAVRDLVAFEPVAETLGISHLLDRRPSQLSGGEMQRVAIGRALLASPRVLLLDEPLASLDRARKLEILPLIDTLAREHGVPVIYVSHDLEEVTRLARQVIVLEAGKVVTCGAPEAVVHAIGLRADDDRFAKVSVLTGRVGHYDQQSMLTTLQHPAGNLYLPGPVEAAQRSLRIVIKATDVALAIQPPHGLSIRNVLEGTVVAIQMGAGPGVTVDIALRGKDYLIASITRPGLKELGLVEGSRVYALVKSAAIDEPRQA